MDIKKLVDEILKQNKTFVNLQDVEKICRDKYNLNKTEFISLLKELKDSKYCLPLVDARFKFNFITLTSWGTDLKQYIVNGASYTCIERYQ